LRGRRWRLGFLIRRCRRGLRHEPIIHALAAGAYKVHFCRGQAAHTRIRKYATIQYCEERRHHGGKPSIPSAVHLYMYPQSFIDKLKM